LCFFFALAVTLSATEMTIVSKVAGALTLAHVAVGIASKTGILNTAQHGETTGRLVVHPVDATSDVATEYV